MDAFIPVNQPLLNGNEKKYLLECIETGWISSEGRFIQDFEGKIAALMDRKYGIAVANGSVALDTAVMALELEPGDEVIMPTFTIISCAAAIIRAGCRPVLVDCDPYTWNMDTEQIEAKITTRTRAIMVVHIYGLPVDMDPILKIAEKYGLFIIEDAAEVHGQTYKGRACGGFGDISTLSFYPNKHITTGEGGMLLTNSGRLAERCRSIRNLFFKAERRYVHEEIGYNFRMTNMQAAVGLAQAERLTETVTIKKHIGDRYTELLTGVKNIQLPLRKTEYADNIYWVYGVVLKDEVSFNALEMMKCLQNVGIGSRAFFWPMHEQPVFQKKGLFANESYPIAEGLARRGFYLPSGVALVDTQIERVAIGIKEILSQKN